MSFNSDRSKRAYKVTFSRKINKVYHVPLLFNNSAVQQISSQKHLGIHLNEELRFKHHINEKKNKDNNDIGIISKLNNILSRSVLLTIYHYTFTLFFVSSTEFKKGKKHIIYLLFSLLLFNSKLFLICFLQSFFVKRCNNSFVFKITNNICPRNSVFSFFNNKNVFRPIWNIAFSKNVFIF